MCWASQHVSIFLLNTHMYEESKQSNPSKIMLFYYFGFEPHAPDYSLV